MENTFKKGDIISCDGINGKYTIWDEDDFWYCLKPQDSNSAIRIPKKGDMEKWHKVG